MPQSIIEHEFDFKETVILKTDRDKLPRIIVAIEVTADGEPLYKAACGTTTSLHYGYEMLKVNENDNKIYGFVKQNGNGY